MTEGTFLRKHLDHYPDNKSVPIAKVLAVEIEKFRTFVDQTVYLGDHITVFSGRNGTLKTALLGLIAHPFESSGVDAFGKTLKTNLSEVFKLSKRFDKDPYRYKLILQTASNEMIGEPVSIYYVEPPTDRHRVVVSGAEKGDGNFSFNTSFLNLKRLYPLVDTRAEPDNSQQLTPEEHARLKRFYERVFPSTSYGNFSAIHQKNVKTTFAPHGQDAKFDWNSISSGEDNLGSIFNRLLGFERAPTQANAGNGILCIDEFESSLHPVAQIRLFDYLYRWSTDWKVQVVITTHSLHLIQHIYLKHGANMNADRVVMNFVSRAKAKDGNFPILKNPTYHLAYRELTLEEPIDVAKARKIRVFCEDRYAIHFTRSLVKSRKVLSLVEFHQSLNPTSGTPGTSYSNLKTICVNYPLLLDNSLVVFDGDVGTSITGKIKNKDSFLVLPDPSLAAIERRIIHFILSRENHDAFFSAVGTEREAFLDRFAAFGIPLNPVDAVLDGTAVSITKCKKWADSDAVFTKYITYYVRTLTDAADFQKEFLAKVNKLNAENGLPQVDI